jgi:hypothetical protein
MDDELHPNIGVVRLVPAVWLVGQLSHGRADAGQDIAGTGRGSRVKIFKNSFAIGEGFRGKSNLH